MIKKFEQFVNEMYSPVNEAFQSSKLRDIIKTHGMPKWDIDKKMLYDIKDNEVIDVVNSRDEYYKKYSDGYNGERVFIIELKDGSCVVIGNLKIFKWFLSDLEQDTKKNVFKRRHEERHIGNTGTKVMYKKNRNGKLVKNEVSNDDIHKKHIESIEKIEQRRLAEKLQPSIPEIIENIKSILEEIDLYELIELGEGKHDNLEIESKMTIDSVEYDVYVYYSASIDEYKNRGSYEYTIEYELDEFELYNDYSGVLLSNDVLGITYKTHKDLFKTYKEKEDGGVYDPYEAYGVDPSDFV